MNNLNAKNNLEPLLIYKPYNLAVLLTFYSPLIVSIIIISLSFVFQNFKGFIYLLWLIVFTWIRSIGLEITGAKPIFYRENDLCSMIQYSKYGNSTFSMFFISFSLVYICLPMIINKDINYFLLSAFLFYLLLDVGVRYYSGCVTKISEIFLDCLLGITTGVISTMAMYMTKTQKYLFFNEVSSTKDVCSLPSKQTFKCSLYKNGELVSTSNN
jgi:hypothetical protein